MALNQINPYLLFNGTAAQAIQLYEKALGAKVLHKMTYGEAPCPPGLPAEMKDKIIHAMLQAGNAQIQLSDCPSDRPAPAASAVMVSLNFDEVPELERAFHAMAEGGKVCQALHDAFWGSRFGMVTDPFNITWMFSAVLPRA